MLNELAHGKYAFVTMAIGFNSEKTPLNGKSISIVHI